MLSSSLAFCLAAAGVRRGVPPVQPGDGTLQAATYGDGSLVRPFLLIHPSKTGGTSITAGMGIGAEVRQPFLTPECDLIPRLDMRYKKHDTAAIARTYYTEDEWNAAYVFALVRNPYERLVSWWAMQATPPVQNDPCGCNGSDTAVSYTLNPADVGSDPRTSLGSGRLQTHAGL